MLWISIIVLQFFFFWFFFSSTLFSLFEILFLCIFVFSFFYYVLAGSFCVLFTMRRNYKLCNSTETSEDSREKTKRSFVVYSFVWIVCVFVLLFSFLFLSCFAHLISILFVAVHTTARFPLRSLELWNLVGICANQKWIRIISHPMKNCTVAHHLIVEWTAPKFNFVFCFFLLPFKRNDNNKLKNQPNFKCSVTCVLFVKEKIVSFCIRLWTPKMYRA